MSITITSHSLLNNLEPSLQESGSWAGKVITKVHTTTSCAISSIDSVAQSILSHFIYVGTLGRYTLDDLKDYFSVSLENRDVLDVPSEKDDIEEKEIRKSDSSLKEMEEISQSRLNRHPSRVSIGSQFFRNIHASAAADSPYSKAYQGMSEMVKLSTGAHSQGNSKNSLLQEQSSLN